MGRWAVLAQNLIQNHCGAVSVERGGEGGGVGGSWGLLETPVMSKTAGSETISLPPSKTVYTKLLCTKYGLMQQCL